MRGSDQVSDSLFSYIDLEARVPVEHPLRVIRSLVNDVLADMSGDFTEAYSLMGRPGIAPERLLRSLLLQAFYSIRSERQLMEQLDYNMLFRWFVGLGLDDRVWNASTFCQNRDRLLTAEVSKRFLSGIISHEQVKPLLSRDHFSVDGTLIEAWASMKSFQPIDRPATDDHGDGPKEGSGGARGSGRNRDADFHGQRRGNDTHRSMTDPDARL